MSIGLKGLREPAHPHRSAAVEADLFGELVGVDDGPVGSGSLDESARASAAWVAQHHRPLGAVSATPANSPPCLATNATSYSYEGIERESAGTQHHSRCDADDGSGRHQAGACRRDRYGDGQP